MKDNQGRQAYLDIVFKEGKREENANIEAQDVERLFAYRFWILYDMNIFFTLNINCMTS